MKAWTIRTLLLWFFFFELQICQVGGQNLQMDFIFVTIVWKFTNKKTTNCYSLFVPPFSLLGGCVFFYYVCRGFIKSLPYMQSIFWMVMSMWVLGLLQFLEMWIQRVWTIACDMHSHVQVIKKDQVLGEKTK